MARPRLDPTDRMVPMSISVQGQLYDAVSQCARKRGVSLSYVVRVFLATRFLTEKSRPAPIPAPTTHT